MKHKTKNMKNKRTRAQVFRKNNTKSDIKYENVISKNICERYKFHAKRGR